MESKPVYDVATPKISRMPLITGPVIVEYEPNMFVDLSQAVEAQVIDGDLFLVLPAPSDVERGPHVVGLTGEPRDLALAYFRHRAFASRAALRALMEQA